MPVGGCLSATLRLTRIIFTNQGVTLQKFTGQSLAQSIHGIKQLTHCRPGILKGVIIRQSHAGTIQGSVTADPDAMHWQPQRPAVVWRAMILTIKWISNDCTQAMSGHNCTLPVVR